MQSQDNSSGSYTIVLQPSGNEPLTVLFEPGAGEFELDPGRSFRIDICGPASERVEISHGEGHVSVWPSPALSIRVRDSIGAEVPLLGYRGSAWPD